MAPAKRTSVTRQFLDQATVFTDAPRTAGDAAAAGDYRAAWRRPNGSAWRPASSEQALVRDALARDADWQELADMLGMHPQAAFETCAHLAGHATRPPSSGPTSRSSSPQAWQPNTTCAASTGSTSRT